MLFPALVSVLAVPLMTAPAVAPADPPVRLGAAAITECRYQFVFELTQNGTRYGPVFDGRFQRADGTTVVRRLTPQGGESIAATEDSHIYTFRRSNPSRNHSLAPYQFDVCAAAGPGETLTGMRLLFSQNDYRSDWIVPRPMSDRAVPGAPEIVEVSPDGPAHVTLRWKPVQGQEIVCYLVMYVYPYQSIEPPELQWRSFNKQVTGLTGTAYLGWPDDAPDADRTVAVVAVTADGFTSDFAAVKDLKFRPGTGSGGSPQMLPKR